MNKIISQLHRYPRSEYSTTILQAFQEHYLGLLWTVYELRTSRRVTIIMLHHRHLLPSMCKEATCNNKLTFTHTHALFSWSQSPTFQIRLTLVTLVHTPSLPPSNSYTLILNHTYNQLSLHSHSPSPSHSITI